MSQTTLLQTPNERFWANASLSVTDKEALGVSEPALDRKAVTLACLLDQPESVVSSDKDWVFDQTELVCRWLQEGISPFTPLPDHLPKEHADAKYDNGKSVWQRAVELELKAVVAWCFEHYPNDSQYHMKLPLRGTRDLPLHVASASKDVEMIAVFAQHGCDFNQMDSKGETALMKAKDVDTLNALVDGGASLTQVDNEGHSAPWHWQNTLMNYTYDGMKRRYDALQIQQIQNPVHLIESLLKEIKAKNIESTNEYAKAVGENSWSLDASEAFKKPVNLMTAVALRVGQNKKAGAFYKAFLSRQDDSIFNWNTPEAPSALGLLLMVIQMEEQGYLSTGRGRVNLNGAFYEELKGRVFRAWDEYRGKFGVEKAWLLPLQSVQGLKVSNFDPNFVHLLTALTTVGRERYMEHQHYDDLALLPLLPLLQTLSTSRHLSFGVDYASFDKICSLLSLIIDEAEGGKLDSTQTFQTVWGVLLNSSLNPLKNKDANVMLSWKEHVQFVFDRCPLDVLKEVLNHPELVQYRQQDWLNERWVMAEKRILDHSLNETDDKPSSKMRL